jgi:6-phosphogluconolactonase
MCKFNLLRAPILIFFVFTILGACDIHNSTKYYFFYAGTYTNEDSKGIYLYKMNSETGKLTFVDVTENISNPSFLSIDKSNNFLYAVNEVADFDSGKNGSVSAFKVDAKTKQLKFINKVSSGGAHPCYVTIDSEGKFIFAANYSGGNICVLPINKDGSLSIASDIANHSGSSVNKKRQNAPHAHSVYVDPYNKYIYAVDLGIDKINIYKFDSDNGRLLSNEPAFFKADPGSGPRHMAFHPTNKFAYVINELDNKIIALKITPENGGLNKIESYPTLPSDFIGTSYCADIHIHPNGKFLYGSNRGHNSIVIFKINEKSGKLTTVGHKSTMGDWPRNFTIDPSGKFLLVANQKSNNIVVFRIDCQSGMLEGTKSAAEISSPVCLKFLN